MSKKKVKYYYVYDGRGIEDGQVFAVINAKSDQQARKEWVEEWEDYDTTLFDNNGNQIF